MSRMPVTPTTAVNVERTAAPVMSLARRPKRGEKDKVRLLQVIGSTGGIGAVCQVSPGPKSSSGQVRKARQLAGLSVSRGRAGGPIKSAAPRAKAGKPRGPRALRRDLEPGDERVEVL